MLRRYRQIQTQLQQLLDAALFAAAFCIAYLVRDDDSVMAFFHLGPPSPFQDYVWLYLILIPAAPMLLERAGFYDRPLLAPRLTAVWPLLKGCALILVLLTVVSYFFNLSLARPIAVIFVVVSLTMMLAKAELMRLVYRSRFTQAQLRRRFLLVGAGSDIQELRRELQNKPELGVHIVAELDLDTTPVEHLVTLLHQHAVNGVIVSTAHAYFGQAERIVGACEREGVETWLLADFVATQISRMTFDEFRGRPVMVFRSAPEVSWPGVVKQVLDFTVAACLLILLSPMFLLVAWLIQRKSPGPVFFKQTRAGLNGHPFTMYKFRTMVTDAEQKKDELAKFNEMSGPVFKMTNDPRIIPIGRFLRKYSIDEFPQLYNVFRGDMSLVGPRPLPVDEVSRFDDLAHRRRLSVKPGLTCLWQVKGRNQVTDFKDWVRLDLEYIDHWSLWLDFQILLRTVPAVVAGAGAK
jgi:exopolysaccharide biosynthesis polyprenyl glycosylphosphotransferase